MFSSPPQIVRIEIPVGDDPGPPDTWRADHTVLLDRMTALVRRRELPRHVLTHDAPINNELGWCCTRTLSFDDPPAASVSSPAAGNLGGETAALPSSQTPTDESSASVGVPGGGRSPLAAAQPSSPSERVP